MAFARKWEVSFSEVARRVKGTGHNYIQTLEVGMVMSRGAPVDFISRMEARFPVFH